MQSGAATLEDIVAVFFFFLAKLNILLPYKPAVISLGVYPNERNLYSPKAAWDILATLIITAQTRK